MVARTYNDDTSEGETEFDDSDIDDALTGADGLEGEQRTMKPEDVNGPCQCMLSGSRNLVVCIDGTSNQFGTQNTNIVELYSRLVKSDDQLTYYNSGIGTYVKDSESWLSFKAWQQFFRHNIDKAFATNFKAKVLGAYEWLSENYKPGDRIFLFGFSRGAYQVRVVAGMIEKVGLLHKGNNEQIAFAYDLYTQTIATKNAKELQESEELCRRFKQTLSRRNVKVHFVGSWDTVSAVGVFRGLNFPETTTGMRHVCIFRHALALDELRVKFLPEYANGGAGPIIPDDESTHFLGLRHQGDVKEVWFAGSHSDIGGGNVANLALDHFGPSLRWMSYEAIKQGLKMEPHRSPWGSLIPKSSMNLFYRLIEYLPISRLSYTGPDTVVRWPPNRQNPRRVLPGQLIHESVFEQKLKEIKYKPIALLWGETPVWDEQVLRARKMVEDDPYARADDILQALDNFNNGIDVMSHAHYDALAALSASPLGKKSITEFSNSMLILRTALEAEYQKAISNDGNLDLNVITTLANAVNLFEVLPRKREYVYDPALWSIFDKLYKRQSPAWLKFYDCFGPIQPSSAIVIGINAYTSKDLANLKGCVDDARDIAKFLKKSLRFPHDQISMLFNERATRDRIIQSIFSLASNQDIMVGDPLVIFFAGHSMINDMGSACIIPYDYPEAQPIPSSVINDMLAQVAAVKGNNIVLILDCAHAAGFGGDTYTTANFSSHVLLAACGAREVSREVSGRGWFTKNLTKMLRHLEVTAGRYDCTYRDIIRRFPSGSQTPSSHGKYDGRHLFCNQEPHEISSILNAEESGTRSQRDSAVWNSLLGQREANELLSISVLIDDSSVSYDMVEQLLRQDSDSIRFVDQNTPHQFVILVRASNIVIEGIDHGQLMRIIMDDTRNTRVEELLQVLKHVSHFIWNLWRSPPTISNNPTLTLSEEITVEAWRLGDVDGRYTSDSSPIGENLNQDGAIRISVSDEPHSTFKLAFKLTNSSRLNLFVWAFAFDPLDMNIDTIYKPAFVVNSETSAGSSSLPSEGHLMFSNVFSGIRLTTRPRGVEESVSYLKIYVSSHFIDLSFIERASPLDISNLLFEDPFDPQIGVSDLNDALVPVTGTLRLRGGGAYPLHKRRRPELWDSIVIPIIKSGSEKGKASSPNVKGIVYNTVNSTR